MTIHATIRPDTGLSGDVRRHARAEAAAGVALRPLGSGAVPARLLNLSSHGFMAETDAEIRPGTRAWLSLPGMAPANVLVIWVKGTRLGGEFAVPIDPLAVFQTIGAGHKVGP